MAFSSADIQGSLGEFFTVKTVGIEDLEANLEQIRERIVRSINFTCKISARVVLFNSRHHVPYDTGALFDSSKVTDVSDRKDFPEYEVTYDTEYAAAVHEMFKEYIQGKGPYPQFLKTAKFLENAAKSQAEKFPEDVAKAVDDAIHNRPAPPADSLGDIPVGGGLSSGTGKPKLVKKSK